jgi:hypothetical protein
MSHPWQHAVSSAHRFGGRPEDYIFIHNWFDETKAFLCDFRHRALRHHAEGIFECERVFGVTIRNSDGREVPVRPIGEQHVREDCGGIVPSAADWLRNIRPRPWMNRRYQEPSGLELATLVGLPSGGAGDEAQEEEVDIAAEAMNPTIRGA